MSKNQNAVKHGAFAEAVILPGEDAKEFAELHDSLINEWGPEGSSEHETISSLAKNMWRKRRVIRYQKNEVATWQEKTNEIQRRGKEASEDFDVLVKFADNADSGVLGTITEKNLSTKLVGPWVDYFKAYFPRKKYDSDSAWLSAVMHEIDHKLTPGLFDKQCKGNDVPKVEEVFSNNERMAQEMGLEERIDSMIDKTIKRLCQIKTMKEVVIRIRHTSGKNEPLRQIGPPAN